MTETLKRGFPGMKSLKDMPILQDSPPPGGFPAIRIERRLPSTGPTGVTIFGLTAAVMAYGYYKVYLTMQEKREIQAENDLLKAAITPILQAETDFRLAAQLRAKRAREAEIMKDVPGWVNDDGKGRWIPPIRPPGMWDPILQ